MPQSYINALSRILTRCWVLAFAFLAFSASAQNTISISSQKLIPASGDSKDMFGFSVATDGNYVLAGSLRQDHGKNGADTGAAFLYELKDEHWQQLAILIPEDAKPKDGIGGKVAIHKSTAAINAIGYDGDLEDIGIVYIYEPDESGQWQEKDRITAPDARTGDAFGQAIALSENYLVIGAPKDDDKGEDSGSVYIYQYIDSKWTFIQKLMGHDSAAGDVYGISVAISNETMLIGADLNDEKANNAGAAYVYTKAKDQWQLQAKLTAHDPGDTDIFAVRVALDNNTAVISARRDDHEGIGKDAGSVYVFERTGNTWLQTAKLIGPDSHADDRFGRDVAIAEDSILIGAMHKDDKGENAGAAYLYKRQGNDWVLNKSLYAQDASKQDLFGWSVALSVKHAVVGATRGAQGDIETGAVYVHKF